MDISLTFFTPSASLNRRRRPFPPVGAGTRRFAAAGCRRATTSGELQTAAGPNGRGGSYPAAVPVHKVTVHDRQRGVVHEISVPEGYALLCVGFPSSDLEVETQDEDEVYWLQFGRYFARGPIDRDDYALELALGDE